MGETGNRSVLGFAGGGIWMYRIVNALMRRIINLMHVPINIIRTTKLFFLVIRRFRLSEEMVGNIRLERCIDLLSGNIGILWRFASTSKTPTHKSDTSRNSKICFVLGNGPSLDVDINEKLAIFSMGDTFCVNDFAYTDLYIKIQPKYYVFADPCWWISTSPENIVSRRNRLFGEILSKTTWPLTIYAPFEARSFFESIFLHSHNIRLSFYNANSLTGKKTLENIIYDLGLAMPICQNVLVSALYLSLHNNYKKIILLGADHSWHETLALDDANRVCMKNRHFFDKDAKLTPWTKDGTDENIWTMGDLFHALANMFEGYWQIEKYAEFLGAQICNASSVTFIDAFERKSFAELSTDIVDDKLKHG
jgi:hypothetical protein